MPTTTEMNNSRKVDLDYFQIDTDDSGAVFPQPVSQSAPAAAD